MSIFNFGTNLAIALSLAAIVMILVYVFLIRPDQKERKKSARV